MTRATDYLRNLGMTEEQITKMQAELDQHTAEADHLIDHALRLHRGTVYQAALEGVLIRTHVDDIDDKKLRTLFGVLVSRTGMLAATLEDLSKDNTRLKAELAAAREGTA